MMQVYAVRHGQSEYNLLGLCNDDPLRGVSLTELGQQQARRAADALRGKRIAQIYSSPLPRTLQTAAFIAAACGAPLTEEPRLADIRSGCEGLPVVDYQAAIADDPLHGRVNDGESLLDYQARVNGFLDWLCEQPHPAVVLVAHEETLRVFRAYAERLPASAMPAMQFANGEVYRFTC